MREQARILDLYLQYIELIKLFKTISKILYKRGSLDSLSLINELAIFKLATVLRELIIHHFKNRKQRELTKYEFFGEECTMQYFYEICCKVIHIKLHRPELPEDFLLRMDFIGNELYKLCDKNDPTINDYIQKPHLANYELLLLYGLS